MSLVEPLIFRISYASSTSSWARGEDDILGREPVGVYGGESTYPAVDNGHKHTPVQVHSFLDPSGPTPHSFSSLHPSINEPKVTKTATGWQELSTPVPVPVHNADVHSSPNDDPGLFIRFLLVTGHQLITDLAQTLKNLVWHSIELNTRPASQHRGNGLDIEWSGLSSLSSTSQVSIEEAIQYRARHRVGVAAKEYALRDLEISSSITGSIRPGLTFHSQLRTKITSSSPEPSADPSNLVLHTQRQAAKHRINGVHSRRDPGNRQETPIKEPCTQDSTFHSDISFDFQVRPAFQFVRHIIVNFEAKYLQRGGSREEVYLPDLSLRGFGSSASERLQESYLDAATLQKMRPDSPCALVRTLNKRSTALIFVTISNRWRSLSRGETTEGGFGKDGREWGDFYSVQDIYFYMYNMLIVQSMVPVPDAPFLLSPFEEDIITPSEQRQSSAPVGGEPKGGFENGDGDTQSVSTVVPHDLESVEEDENQEADLENPRNPRHLITLAKPPTKRPPSPSLLSQSRAAVATEEIQEQNVQLTVQARGAAHGGASYNQRVREEGRAARESAPGVGRSRSLPIVEEKEVDWMSCDGVFDCGYLDLRRSLPQYLWWVAAAAPLLQPCHWGRRFLEGGGGSSGGVGYGIYFISTIIHSHFMWPGTGILFGVRCAVGEFNLAPFIRRRAYIKRTLLSPKPSRAMTVPKARRPYNTHPLALTKQNERKGETMEVHGVGLIANTSNWREV
ncbi:hypothetical protein DFP72DRAFT_1048329 [Ephemerocybe angulata]|uniref:Uncharacterized protein n=1 Tax=Ephemerocybe angulata TaxID=980116 RepID=A0A8H6HPX6_9AGAR|nr:hypothetical protein DFP72DRAFT_1048329 [Tulosesus angulatus]